MTSFVLDPFRFALRGAARLFTVDRVALAPRVAHAPAADTAEGIEARYRYAQGRCDPDGEKSYSTLPQCPFKR